MNVKIHNKTGRRWEGDNWEGDQTFKKRQSSLESVWGWAHADPNDVALYTPSQHLKYELK